MGFQVTVSAPRDLASIQKALKQLGDKGLGKEMSKQLVAAGRPLRRELRAEVPKVMPSGYAPVLSKSYRFRQQTKSGRQTAHVVLRLHADGQKERRDLPSLNRGRLRHPVYGRRRQAWVDQKVRAGVVDRPIDRVQPQVRRQMEAVLDYVADQLKG